MANTHDGTHTDCKICYNLKIGRANYLLEELRAIAEGLGYNVILARAK